MKKFTWLVLMIGFLPISLKTFSQENNFSAKEALELVSKNVTALSLSADALQNSIVSDAYADKYANTKMVYLQQTFKGVPVFNSIKTIAFKNDKVVSSAGMFVGKAEVKASISTGVPVITSAAAVEGAATHLSLVAPANIVATSGNEQQVNEYSSLGISRSNITTKLVWISTMQGELKLSWQVKILPLKTPDYWLVNVDAASGGVINKFNLTVYDNWSGPESHDGNVQQADMTVEESPAYHTSSTNTIASAAYRVAPYPAESPAHPGGAPTLILSPWNNAGTNSNATTLGWHNDGVADHDSTRGNNVWAREDRADDDGFPRPGRAAVSITASPNLTFDFPAIPTQNLTSTSNQNFGITQLFYWNNIMHDITYLYGFDEVSGNFQNSNLGRGGLGNDYVIADAQDGGGTNNANFSPPEDGISGRMQMYLWSPSRDSILKINSPSAIAGSRRASESAFSANNKLVDVGPVTGQLVLYAAAGGDTLACSATTNVFNDKIVVISRGTCSFTAKVKNAQNAGALAVIMINNVTGNPVAMPGNDNTITIPAVMISLTDGKLLKGAIRSGQAVIATLRGDGGYDGDLDNGVMGHEYTHGISNRLTGGPASAGCLQNAEQMGEGWSDYFALMTTTNWQTALPADGPNRRPIGNYVTGQNAVTGAGIRNYPYSTNLSINPWTYDMMTNTGGEVHNIGEIWATVLWDMTWNMIQVDGINPNLYDANAAGGNSAALKLVTEGMKLQPCSPGFLDGRDAILKADTILYNGKYGCAIWNAFARRHMGTNASQGSSNSYTDGVGGTELPVAIVKKSVDKVRAAQNEEITYTLTAACQCTPISNYNIVDTLPTNVTWVSGGSYNAGDRTVTFNIPSLAQSTSISYTLKVLINTGTYTPPVIALDEQISSAAIPATLTATATGSGAWAVSTVRSHTGGNSLKAVDAATASSQILTTVSSFPVVGITTLSFWHYFETEAGFDGGVVELSLNNGTTWFDAARYMLQNGYNSGSAGFSGSSGGQFIQTIVNLSSFHGKSVKVRFRFTSDAGLGMDGWYLDDILLKNEAGVYNNAGLFTSGGQLQTAADTATLIDNIVPLTWGDFTALKDGMKALLKWTTLQEMNTKEFVVERSTNSTAFEPVGKLNAAGISAQPLSYRFTDVLPNKGLNYYRIRQIDSDGHFTFSKTRTLTFDKVNEVVITPNPAKDKITISIPGNAESLQVSFITMEGKKVASFQMNNETLQLNISRFAAGVYYVKVDGESISITKKLVVK